MAWTSFRRSIGCQPARLGVPSEVVSVASHAPPTRSSRRFASGLPASALMAARQSAQDNPGRSLRDASGTTTRGLRAGTGLSAAASARSLLELRPAVRPGPSDTKPSCTSCVPRAGKSPAPQLLPNRSTRRRSPNFALPNAPPDVGHPLDTPRSAGIPTKMRRKVRACAASWPRCSGRRGGRLRA